MVSRPRSCMLIVSAELTDVRYAAPAAQYIGLCRPMPGSRVEIQADIAARPCWRWVCRCMLCSFRNLKCGVYLPGVSVPLCIPYTSYALNGFQWNANASRTGAIR